MRRVSPYLAVLMVYLMTPGAGEIVENVIHLATDGHTAHAAHDDEHDEEHEAAGEEHGCSGTFHMCQCCSAAPFTAAPERDHVSAAVHIHDGPAWAGKDTKADGYLSGVFRPPIA